MWATALPVTAECRRKFSVMRRIFFILAIVPLMVHAQETDVVDYVSDNEGGRTVSQVWTEVGVTKVLPHNLSLGFDVGFRTEDWFKDASRFDIGISLNWKASKHWKFGVGYTFVNKHYFSETERKHVSEIEYKYKESATGDDMIPDPTSFLGAPYYYDANGTRYAYDGYNDSDKDYVRDIESYWRPKHRLSFDASYTSKYFGFLRLTLRERYQLTYLPTKEVSRVRTRTKTVRKYREPRYPDGVTFSEEYDAYFDMWQEDETIYSLEYRDDDWDGIYEPEPVQDVTATYLATHDNEGLNTVVDQSKEKRCKWLHVLRTRLTFEIDKKGWKWTPFLYVESFNNLGDGWHFDKLRASAGVDYALSKRHKIGLGYIFNHENDDDGDENIHAINVSYKFKF